MKSNLKSMTASFGIGTTALAAGLLFSACVGPDSLPIKKALRNELQASGTIQLRREDAVRIAVIPAAKQAIAEIDYNAVIDENFAKVLLGKGYTVVDRETLELVLREQELSTGPAFDDAAAPKVGKLLGATHVVIVRLPYFIRVEGGYYQARVQAKIVKVETGQVVGTVSAENRIKSVIGITVVENWKELLQAFQNPADAFGSVCRASADQLAGPATQGSTPSGGKSASR